MKKFLMTVCAGLFSLGLWADSVTTNGVTWTFSVSNGRATLGSWCISTSVKGALEIPDMLGGYPVTDIGQRAFEGRSQLTENYSRQCDEYCGRNVSEWKSGKRTLLPAICGLYQSCERGCER